MYIIPDRLLGDITAKKKMKSKIILSLNRGFELNKKDALVFLTIRIHNDRAS